MAEVATQEPEEIFHYTDVGGLKGIVENGELWCTDIQYLNDGSEFTHGIELIEKEIKKICRSLDGLEPRFLEGLLDIITDYTRPENGLSTRRFVFSLSEESDSLSQWRAYASEGGVRLGFSKKLLGARAAQLGWMIDRCVYQPGKKKRLILERVVNPAREHFKENKGEVGDDGLQDFISEYYQTGFFRNYVLLCPWLKHESFEREHEWRLIGGCNVNDRFDEDGNGKEIDWRSRGSMLLPFCKLRIDEKTTAEGDDFSIPLTSVIIGPSSYPYLLRNSVASFLKRHHSEGKIPHIFPHISDTSYRVQSP